MSIFNTSNLITAPTVKTTAQTGIVSNPPPGQLTYGIFYLPGTTFSGNYGKFVKT